MSVAIATMGMFIPSTGSGGGATLVREEPKPVMQVLKVENNDEDDETIKNKITVTFIGD